MPQFFGKYRGKVTNNRDPLSQGRLQVSVPAVLGDIRESWAMPCVPYAGAQVGFFALPPVGANIWVEFEDGQPEYPIWSGCFWGPGELPVTPAVPEVKCWKTNGITLTFSEIGPSLGVTLEVAPPLVPQPLTLQMNAQGITLTNGNQTTLTLTAQQIACSSGQTAHITIAANAVEVQQGAAALKLAASGLELSHSPAAVKISAQGVEVSSEPAKLTVAPANIELSNGAANVKLSPASVNVNNGALEVI